MIVVRTLIFAIVAIKDNGEWLPLSFLLELGKAFTILDNGVVSHLVIFHSTPRYLAATLAVRCFLEVNVSSCSCHSGHHLCLVVYNFVSI